MSRQVHIIEVVLRHAVVAENAQSALDVIVETMTSFSEDGCLSDMFVYEWDDPIYIRAEETSTE